MPPKNTHRHNPAREQSFRECLLFLALGITTSIIIALAAAHWAVAVREQERTERGAK